jgi:hypothetical protein
MKIKHKSIKQDKKAKCCNNYASDLYQLDGWAKNDWLCAYCFIEELIESEAEYEVIPKKIILIES